MSEKLVKIAAFASPVEANFAQNVLTEEGIESCIENEATVGLFWPLGNAVGGVKLFVHESDAQRARALLAEHLPEPFDDEPQTPAGVSGGRCKKCDAKLEPDFEVCWSCGEPVEDSEPAPHEAEAAIAAEQPSPKRIAKPKPKRETIIDEADDLAKKAWFSAILGLFLCPPILHGYSAWLIALLLINRFPLSRRGYRRLLFAAAVDALVFAFLIWMICRYGF
jgi:hypothetical protein